MKPFDTSGRVRTVHVLGSINWDIAVSVARRPEPGETVLGHALTGLPGGKGANQAVAAARLGAQVSMYGAVGADGRGADLVSLLGDEGIEVSNITADADTTGTAVLTLTDDGENSIIVVPGANSSVADHHVDCLADHVEPDDVVLFQLEVPAATVRQAAAVASAVGATVILNAAPYDDVSDMLPSVDIVVLNETEAEALWGPPVRLDVDARRAARELAARHDVACIITLGAAGAVMATPDTEPCHASAPSITAVDTTGAGDTFVGALAAFLGFGIDLDLSVRLAVHAGSQACLARGAQSAMPTRPALTDALRNDPELAVALAAVAVVRPTQP